MKAYTSFQDINGNQYGFDNYIDFATWYFNQFRRTLVTYFSSETLKKLQYAAANSKEARTKYEA